MDTNETGREPTEPTDAELEAIEVLRQRFARWWHEVGSGIAPGMLEEWSEHAERVARAAWVDGAFMSGARPMPDTPAPDEVDATLVKLIDLLTRTANAVKGQPGEMKQHGWADLPELCTALSARVAEMDAELRRLVDLADRALGDHSAPNDCYSTGPMTGDPIQDLVACPGCAYKAEVDKIKARIAVPGKEPTSE